MEEKLSLRFVCPNCFTPLSMNLLCSNCDFKGLFQGGKFHLHRNDKSWNLCLEQNAAVEKANVWQREQQVDKSIQEAKKAEDSAQSSKNASLELQDCIIKFLQPIRDKIFLEIGGQFGWASKRFAEAGASGALLDIKGKSLPSSTKQILSIVGDGYYLPFANDQFDFVYDCASLHHFLNMKTCLREIKRVLKDGGIYYSQGNPPRPENITKSQTRQNWYWESFGLIETQPNLEEYREMFKDVFGNFGFFDLEMGYIMIGKKII